MAGVIGRDEFNDELQAEYAHLSEYVNEKLWDEASGFYYDRAPDGTLSKIKSIGAYWGLLAGIVPEARAARLVAHLEDPALFNRPHRIPSQAADSEGYTDHGAYWRGGVWAPTNYMVLQALTAQSEDALAYEIGRNHVENVAQVFTDTGTLWENYAPEIASPGRPAKGDFVGWTGVSAITIPLEYVIGLRPDDAQNLTWDIHLAERHGVKRYPLGSATIDLICDARPGEDAPPHLTVTTAATFTLNVRWGSGSRTWEIAPGTRTLQA
jgi:glycogen debranching enzyme